jgi:hypothetical protein
MKDPNATSAKEPEKSASPEIPGRFSIALPSDLIAHVDAEAAKGETSRSEAISSILQKAFTA